MGDHNLEDRGTARLWIAIGSPPLVIHPIIGNREWHGAARGRNFLRVDPVSLQILPRPASAN